MRRPRIGNLDRRLGRLEGAFRDDVCLCQIDDPVKVLKGCRTVVTAWPGYEQDTTCPDCGRELIVVRLAFDPGEPATAD
ncbi:MAG: hypothetical protein ACRDOS_17015 [Gaiellaceae bacterium]